MRIPFNQSLRPDGSVQSVAIDRPEEIGLAAQKLLDAGCALEIEVLPTGEISMTVERENDDGEVETLAIEVCGNGPQVPAHVDKLIKTAAYALTPAPIVYDDGFMGTCEPSD